MKTGLVGMAWVGSACLALVLSGCSSIGSVNVWPFGDDKPKGRSGPENATEYQCEGGKHFYVRYQDNGNTAWLIYPDREVALTKGTAGTRYSNGNAVLDVNGADATLKDGATVNYTGCKAATVGKQG